MSTKPILFNTDMVRATLDGRKTQTRRVFKQFAPDDAQFGYTAFTPKGSISGRGVFLDWYGEKFYKLPCSPGDILWVRETWAQVNESVGMGLGTKKIIYRANYSDIEAEGWKWHPSIHMPREAARIWLRVTDVRVERLQDITPKDAGDEGVEWETDNSGQFRRSQFMRLWDSTIKPEDRDKHGWVANPFVWVIMFELCGKPENWRT